MSVYSEDPSAYYWKSGGITYEYVNLSEIGGGYQDLYEPNIPNDLGFFNSASEGKETLGLVDRGIDNYARDLGQYNMDVDLPTWMGQEGNPENPGLFEIYSNSNGIPDPTGVEGKFSVTFAENTPVMRDEAISLTITAINDYIDGAMVMKNYLVFEEAVGDVTTRYKVRGEWYNAPSIEQLDGLIIGYTFLAKYIAQNPDALFPGKTADDVVNFANLNWRNTNFIETKFPGNILDAISSGDPVIQNIARDLVDNPGERQGIYLPEEGTIFGKSTRRPGGG